MDKTLREKLKEIESLTQDKSSTLEASISDITEGISIITDVLFDMPKSVDTKLETVKKEVESKISSLELKHGKDGKNGKNGKDGIDGIDGKDGKDGSSDTPGQIADKLETLKGDDRLSSKAIKGLEDYIKRSEMGDFNRTPNVIINRSGGGGSFSSITGTPTEVAYFDALGNGTSDSYFTRDENTKEGTMGFDVPAFGQVNDGSSQQVQWKADNAGTIGNSIALVFDGVDDTDTVLAAWNSANPTNTASVIGGTGNFVPAAGTAQFSGGGISGYSNTLNLGGQGFVGSGSLFSNGATEFSFNGLIGAGNGVTPSMLAADFATGELAILQMDKNGLSASVDTPTGDNSELNVQDNQARLIFNSAVNGESGIWARDSSLQLMNKNITWEWATADGTSGQYLTTDGYGNLSFTSVVVPPPPAPTLADKTIGVGDSSNELTGYNTFVYDRTKSLFTQYIPNQVNGGVALGAPLTFGGVGFTGSGLNDMTINWSVSNYQSKKYGGQLTVTLNGTGTPDTFDWRYAGAYSETVGSDTGVAITGAAQSLTDTYGNVIAEITFGATTGHTDGDYWKANTSLSDPEWGMILRDNDDHQLVIIQPVTGRYIIGDNIGPAALSGNASRLEIQDDTAKAYLNAKNGAYLGDGLEVANKSYLAVFDTLGFGKGKLNDFEIWDINNLASYLRVSTTSKSTSIGKSGGAVLNVEEATSSVVGWVNKFQLNNSAENKYFRAQYNSGNPLIEMGDLDAVGNSVTLTVEDANKQIGITGAIIRGTGFHNSVLAQGSATQQDIRSGTYAPTITSVTNVSTTTSYDAQWMRVGNVVTVSGQVEITPAGNGLTVVGISLPVASNFTATYQCGGTGNSPAITGHGAAIYADATNDRSEFSYINTAGTSSDTMSFTLTYLVI